MFCILCLDEPITYIDSDEGFEKLLRKNEVIFLCVYVFYEKIICKYVG